MWPNRIKETESFTWHLFNALVVFWYFSSDKPNHLAITNNDGYYISNNFFVTVITTGSCLNSIFSHIKLNVWFIWKYHALLRTSILPFGDTRASTQIFSTIWTLLHLNWRSSTIDDKRLTLLLSSFSAEK